MNNENRQKLDDMKALSEIIMGKIRSEVEELQKSESSAKKDLKKAQDKLSKLNKILNEE